MTEKPYTNAHQILGFDMTLDNFQDKLSVIDSQIYQHLIGVCTRLAFISQLEQGRKIKGWNMQEHVLTNQFERLKLYMTITCIDAITGIAFEQFPDWLNRAYKNGSLQSNGTWQTAIQELINAQNFQQTEKLFRKHVNEIYVHDYLNATSKRRAIKNFVIDLDFWLKNWLCNLYVIDFLEQANEQDSNEKWINMSQDQKSERIAEYLYRTRNLYTHTVVVYAPLNFVQRSSKNQIKGYVATFVPALSSNEKVMQISLPVEYGEAEVIRLMIVRWMRKIWLKIDDDENLIQNYWQTVN